MDPLTLAAWSFPALLLLIFLRVPIGLAMLSLGLVGAWLVYGSLAPLLNQMKSLAYSTFSSHSLSIVPLFLLMGQFATHGGLSKSLFDFVRAFMGHMRGGLAMASVMAPLVRTRNKFQLREPLSEPWQFTHNTRGI